MLEVAQSPSLPSPPLPVAFSAPHTHQISFATIHLKNLNWQPPSSEDLLLPLLDVSTEVHISTSNSNGQNKPSSQSFDLRLSSSTHVSYSQFLQVVYSVHFEYPIVSLYLQVV